MPFSPHEIENKRFVVALRGYQTDEVEAFLRSVALDYQALLEQLDSVAPDRWVDDIERVMRSSRDEAEREAIEVRAAAAKEARALRDAAEHEAAVVKQAAEREAAEVREATEHEAEACFTEISRQAEELQRLQTALWARLHALEHTVLEARQTLAHQGDVYPVSVPASNGDAALPEASWPSRATG